MAGAAGSNECPAGSVRIVTEAACRTAAAAAGRTAGLPFVETTSAYPRGCYYASSSASAYNNYAYFNPDPVGRGDSVFRLLCAVTSGAPPPPPPPARAAALSMRTCAIVRALRRCGGAAGYSRRTVPGLVHQSVVFSARLRCGRVAQRRAAFGCAGCLTERYSSVLKRYSRGTLWHSWAARRKRWAVNGIVGPALLCFVRYGTVGYSLGETGRPQRAVYPMVRCGMTSRRGRVA